MTTWKLLHGGQRTTSASWSSRPAWYNVVLLELGWAYWYSRKQKHLNISPLTYNGEVTKAISSQVADKKKTRFTKYRSQWRNKSFKVSNRSVENCDHDITISCKIDILHVRSLTWPGDLTFIELRPKKKWPQFSGYRPKPVGWTKFVPLMCVFTLALAGYFP